MKKKKQKIAPVIAALFVLIFAITFLGCPEPDGGGGSRTKLEGKWESSGGRTITFSRNSFTRITGGTLDYKGSFSLSDDGTINFNISQWSMDGGSKWQNYNQYIDEKIKAIVGESTWNALSAADKQALRDSYTKPTQGITLVTPPPTTDSGTYELLLDGKQLKVIYAGTGTEASRTVFYQKSGTSTVSSALVGKWVLEGAPTVIVLDFSTSQLILSKAGSTTLTFYTLETDGRIEGGTSPGVFTQDLCESYEITGDTLTFTGGLISSNNWYPSTTFKKYVFPPLTPTPLTADQWSDGSITSSIREVWYSFNVTNGTTYRLWWNDGYSTAGDGTKTLDVKVSGYYDADTSIFTDADAAWSTARSFTANKSGTVYVKVIPYSTNGTPTGTFGIVYSSTATTRPGITINPISPTTLTTGVWADSAITGSETEVWYSFSAPAGNTYYVWWNDSYNNSSGNGTKTLDVAVTAYYANGTIIFANYDTAWGTPRSFTPTADAAVYLKVTPRTPGNTGTYGIVYNTSNTRPAPAFPESTTLTEGQWANGNIASAGGQEWFKFTATATPQYIHFNSDFGTLKDVYVQMYDSNGNTVGSRANLYNTYKNTSQAVTVNQTYYIKVTPYGSGNNAISGTYQIGFNTSSTAPTSP